MAEPSVIFFDAGGVLLSNGWDRVARLQAAEAFHLDWEDFQERHDLVVDACLLIEDRAVNLECAALAGITPIHFESAAGLLADLAAAGIEL